MNVKEVVTEEQLHDVLPVLQQLRTETFKRGNKLFISKYERNYKLFSLRNEDDEVVSLAGVTNLYELL